MRDQEWSGRVRRWSMRWAALTGVLLGVGASAQGAEAARKEPACVEVKLHDVPVKVTASSVLADAKNPDRYGPANLLDEDPNTIWAEGVKSTGAGEWVELNFPPGTPVYAFLVTPGNPKSAQLYKANARPRKAKLELKLAEGRQLSYDLDFPKNFPAGGAIYVGYHREWAVESARLTIVSVWPGTKYKDLCLGTFVPVFPGPEEHELKTFLGSGKELAPTLATFMYNPHGLYSLLPPDAKDAAAWLRAYPRVPHDGPPRSPTLEINMRTRAPSDWGYYVQALAEDAAGAHVQSNLFRLTATYGGKSYVFDPIAAPKRQDSFSNFRTRWSLMDGQWRLIEIDVKFQEETPY